MEAYLLGLVDFQACLSLQQRLVYEASGRDDGQISLLVCEHPETITVGRQGSRLHIHLEDRELLSRRVGVHWVNRGGGCLAHAPGQLAIYPIVPLVRLGWTLGEYLNRFQAGLAAVLESLRVAPADRRGAHGLWGRTGQLAAFGVAVKHWTTYHGAFLNIDPSMRLMRAVESDPAERGALSSLMVERQQPVKMTQARSLVISQLAQSFGCEQYHVYSRHPLFRTASRRVVPARRVG